MKYLYLVINIFLLFFLKLSVVTAQMPNHYVDYNGGNNVIPFNHGSNKVQWLYYASDFTNVVPLQAGNITKVFIKAGSTANVVLPTFNIKIGTTTSAAMVNGPWVAGLTTVFTANSYPLTSTINNWVVYTLQTPFYYDGVSNLVFEIEVTPTNAGGYSIHQRTLSNNRRLYGLVGNPNSTGTDGTQAALGFEMNSNCTGMPSAGIITKSAATITCGNAASASLTAATTSGGITKQWQYSVDGINWINSDTGNTANLNNVQQKTYIRCRVTCTHSNQTATTAVDSFLVQQIPFSLGADTTICLNETITLSANLPNQTSVVWNDNSTMPTKVFTQPGTYAAIVTFANGCTSLDTINIAAGQEPVNPLVASYNLCEDSVITLSALNPNMRYLWSTNDTVNQIFVRSSGGYGVTITSRDYCTRTYNTSVIERPKPIVNLPTEHFICIGEPLVLNGTAIHGREYYWNGALMNPILNVQDSGKYVLKVKSEYGCLTYDSTQVNYRPDPVIQGFTFIPNLYENINKVNFALINPVNVDAVLWEFGDGRSSTLFNPVHEYDELKTYDVVVHVTNNCNTNKYDQRITLTPTSTDNLTTENTIHVYPNPAENYLHIDNKSGSKIYRTVIKDITGRIILDNPNYLNSLNIEVLLPGMHLLEIELENGAVFYQKFIKR